MRLNQFLASCGVASRRKADLLIQAGEVWINGQCCRDFSRQVLVDRDRVFCQGDLLCLSELCYYAFYKPVGYLSALRDPLNRPTIFSLVQNVKGKVFHVGRLDCDSEGLLLLMNDGKLAYRLLHPKYRVLKRYYVVVNGGVSAGQLAFLCRGLPFPEGLASFCDAKILASSSGESRLRVSLTQGMKRQIRRMFRTLGLQVVALRREEFAGISLRGISPGECRALRVGEIRALKDLVQL